ncbi:MAG TPA: mechanosensitive ion channel domain-containing protein [Candidatus Babeliales bacterium]|nr:mechanosensitive ion channel domain-containing protein [Candidatus Babeliales bacterium]
MKIISYRILCILSLFMLAIQADQGDNQLGIFDIFSPKKNQSKIFLAGGIDERKNELGQAETTLKDLIKENEQIQKESQEKLEKINTLISSTKRELQQKPHTELKELLNKKLSLLNAEHQEILNLQISHKELISSIEQHIATIKTFLEDPAFKKYRVESKTFFTFQDLLTASSKITEQEETISHLMSKKNTLTKDLESKKNELLSNQKAYKDKVKELEEYQKENPTNSENTAEKITLLTVDFLENERLFLLHKNSYIEFQIKLLERKLATLKTRTSIDNILLKILKEDFNQTIKPSLRITQEDIDKTTTQAYQKKQKTTEITNKLYQEIKKLTAEKEQLLTQLKQTSIAHKISTTDKTFYDAWKVKPETMSSYLALCSLGYLHGHILIIDKRIEQKNANIILENEKSRYNDTEITSLKTWHKIVYGLFKSDDEIKQELETYTTLKTNLDHELATLTEKRNAATSQLNIQNISLTNLKHRIEELETTKNIIFKEHVDDYQQCLAKFKEAQKLVITQIDINNNIIQKYSLAINTINSTLKLFLFTSKQLSTFGLWKRSTQAISIDGLKRIIPDLKLYSQEFLAILTIYISPSFIYASFRHTIDTIQESPSDFLIIFVFLLVIILLYFFLRSILKKIHNYFSSRKEPVYGLHTISQFNSVLIGYASTHLLLWYVYIITTILLYINGMFTEPVFITILFYIVSIAYLSYIVYTFINFFAQYNKENEYVLLSDIFQHRLIQVFRIFAYISVTIFFIREIILALNNIVMIKSELGTILLAIYSIVFRILLLSLVGKDEVLSIIPTTSEIWLWLGRKIDKYYYLFLIGIIVIMIMSDPYIGGYGNLVSYILWNLFLTVIMWWILNIFNEYGKKITSTIFFIQEDDTRKERFNQSKTWYGISIIMLFLCLLFIGILIASWIWWRPITAYDMWDFLNKNRFSAGMGPDDQPIYISIFSFVKLFGFMFAGLLISTIINRLVFQRIYDLLLVEPGIQNTITSISGYIIVATAFIIGLQVVGLTNFLLSIGVVIVGISWIIQDPIKDFASYFILLVQRPIKIGDFIRIDDNIFGVVRQITPRAVILRCKNSHTIVIPNAQVTNKPLNNWNYTRNFFAFDDIVFTVPYFVNVSKIRSILISILQEHPELLKSPQPIVWLNNFDENGYVFLVRGFLSSINTLRQWEITSDIRIKIALACEKEGIIIATPVRMIKMGPEKQILPQEPTQHIHKN